MEFVELFQEYLRINTAHPNPKYHSAVRFLKSAIQKYIPRADIREFEGGNHNPILVATIQGTDSTRKSILLNSHMDVVPAKSVGVSYMIMIVDL